MTSLADAILATLIVRRSSLDAQVKRNDLFAYTGLDAEDLRAARKRQARRS
ncbi:MAG: hypothetical protein HY834_02335 [Devosia nanyangense]|uniref:Uncharacterized protein n=1 Tax=Devosia nanyangense TaxID=1228055 RepID=A0A933L0Y7_9HYPH|nr:hypothetical protein [Devosia nanyangense]